MQQNNFAKGSSGLHRAAGVVCRLRLGRPIHDGHRPRPGDRKAFAGQLRSRKRLRLHGRYGFGEFAGGENLANPAVAGGRRFVGGAVSGSGKRP